MDFQDSFIDRSNSLLNQEEPKRDFRINKSKSKLTNGKAIYARYSYCKRLSTEPQNTCGNLTTKKGSSNLRNSSLRSYEKPSWELPKTTVSSKDIL